MKKIIIPILIAAALWFVMFSPWTKHLFNFWIAMAASTVILTVMSFLLRKDMLKDLHIDVKSIGIGIVAAVALYGIFYLGNFISSHLFDFARPQVDNIYAMKDGQNKLLIALGLLFVIGPAEEYFWRGYVQNSLIKKVGENKAFIITVLIYSLVHIWSFNFMLVMAAMVCGIFWGLMYKYNKNLVPLIISHALWDTFVFIILPI